MTNNAIMNGFLKDLLDILDARLNVDVFVDEGNETTGGMQIKNGGKVSKLLAHARVYELLANDEFMQTYGRHYEVVGLTVGLSTSIMITKERF